MIKQLIIWLVTAAAVYGEDARTLYTANCMACHALDKKIAGPSILEIAHFYKENPAGIVRWSLNPGIKRKGSIRMPPMAHLGKEKLMSVANYMLEISKGRKWKPEKEPEDPFKDIPPAKLQRMFMPDAGPAAIALSLNENVHICWDAGTCQFRYAWNGKFIDQWPVWKGNGNALAKVLGETFTRVGQGNPFGPAGKIKFKGYQEKEKNYIFFYSVGKVEIELKITSGSSKEITLNFTTNAKTGLTYKPVLISGGWLADKGKIKDGILSLSAEEAKSFSITFKGEKK